MGFGLECSYRVNRNAVTRRLDIRSRHVQVAPPEFLIGATDAYAQQTNGCVELSFRYCLMTLASAREHPIKLTHC